jgi:hypothetical protein
MHDRRGVEELRLYRHGQTEHEHRAGVGGLAGEGFEAAPLCVEEGAPLHQILGRVAANDLLWEGAQRHIVVGHLPGRRHQGGGIADDGADGGAEAGHGQLHETHTSA